MKRSEPFILYNYVERETETLENICRIISEEYECRPPLSSIPMAVLKPLAYVAQKVTRGQSALHPVRVRKAAMPTHIIPKWLIDNGFPFQWDFRTALRHIKQQENRFESET